MFYDVLSLSFLTPFTFITPIPVSLISTYNQRIQDLKDEIVKVGIDFEWSIRNNEKLRSYDNSVLKDYVIEMAERIAKLRYLILECEIEKDRVVKGYV